MVKQESTVLKPYRIWLEPDVHSVRDQLPGKIRQRIKKIIGNLSFEHRPEKSRVLDTEGITLPNAVELPRIRLENWRVIYAINDLDKWIWVLAIRRRPPYDYQDIDKIVGKLVD